MSPRTSSTGATTYPVTVSLPANASVLDGSVASVALVTSSAENVLAVPSSAVHTTGTRHTVQVLENGKVQDVTVQVGTVGDTWTEITNGLSAGQEVVLADLTAALPTSATNSSNGSNNNRTGTTGTSSSRPTSMAAVRAAGRAVRPRVADRQRLTAND